MIDYIVIDDETNPRELLIYSIELTKLPFNLVGQGKNLLEGVELIKKLKPQVVFLDIQMPVHNGLKIKEFLKEDETNFTLIFVTAFDQYTIQAIRLSAFDYLLKPIDDSELNECLNRILTQNKKQENVFQQLNSIEDKNVLVLNTHSGSYFINITDILVITADGMYSQFQLEDYNLVTSKPLKFYEDLHPNLFRCHRSYIVNTDYIKRIEGGKIILTNNKEVPISRQKKAKLINLLKAL